MTHARNFFGGLFLADFFGLGLNMADSDDEVAAAFLRPVDEWTSLKF